jgi:dolichyl-diphosphooligosaccharide--protein glycosyltransferase
LDSVAEHQATQNGMYWYFFHSMCFIATLAVPSLLLKRSEAKYVCMLPWHFIFCKKMNRFVLLLAPAASFFAGIAISGIFTWTLVQVWELVESVLLPLNTVKKVSTKTVKEKAANGSSSSSTTASTSTTNGSSSDGKSKKKEKKTDEGEYSTTSSKVSSFTKIAMILVPVLKVIYSRLLLVRVVLGVGLVFMLTNQVIGFSEHSTRMAVMLSNPSIILQGQTQDGRVVMLDDFREAYWWIRDNTPLKMHV